jgi:IPT/TIG domain
MRALLAAAVALSFGGLASGQILSVSCTPTTGPATAGVAYSATCTASGGIAPYAWTITGTLPDGLTYTPSADTTTLAISDTPGVSGSYSYTVEVTDSTPVIPMTATQDYSGTVAPSITSISPTAATAGASGFPLTVNGAGFNSDAVVSFNGTNLTTTVVNSNQVTAAVPGALIATPGTVPVTVTSGGATATPALTFTINPPPVISSISPTSASAGGSAFSLTVNGSGFGADSVVNFNSNTLTPSSITANQVVATVPGNLITTAGTVGVSITTGGVTSTAANFAINPSVTSISPSSATAGGPGFTLTVNGAGFTPGAQVQWNGSNLATSFVNSSQLTAPVLDNLIASQGSAQVTVVSSGLTSNAQTFTILPPPAITSINPATVTAGGTGFTLTINGSGFASGASALWNGSALTTNVLSASEIQALVPAIDISAAGSAQISVKSGNVTSSPVTLTIVAGPALGSIMPDTTTAGSGPVTLNANGTGFASNATVQWTPAGGSTTTLSTTFQSANLLTAAVPSNLVESVGSASVNVLSNGVNSNSLTFTIVAAPTINSISPNAITAGSIAFNMTVIGTGFASGAQVQWNGHSLGTVYNNSGQLTATVLASDVATAGTDHVTVVSGGVTSNTVNFTVVSGPAITSLNPTSATAGGGAFTLTVNGTGFASGAGVLWNTNSLTTSFKNATQVTASVPASLIASAGTASISVKSGGVTSNSVSFTVNAQPPPLSISSIGPTSITGGTGAGLGAVGSCPARVNAAGTLTVNGSGFTASSTVDWNGQAMVTNFVSSTQLTACVSFANIQGYGTAAITVVSGTTTSNAVNIALTVPSISVTGLQTTSAPTQQLEVGVQLGSATPVALQGTVQLSFSSTAPGLPSGYVDPGLQFSTGQTSATFSIGAGSNSARVAALQQGTVEGTITVTLTNLTANGVSVMPSSTVSGTVTIPPLPPVITASSVQITNLSSSGFDVVLTGYSDTRDMTTANFTFTAASGTAFSGTSTFAVPVSSAFTTWFDSAAGQQNGSMFLLTVPFTISGPTSVLGSVSVTLTNSVGTSAPQSASP